MPASLPPTARSRHARAARVGAGLLALVAGAALAIAPAGCGRALPSGVLTGSIPPATVPPGSTATQPVTRPRPVPKPGRKP